MTNQRTSAKETLAKLMATENLYVEHANVPTAGFDLIKRKLFLPNWKNISDDVYTLLISHEVGHALFTPKEKWEEEIMNEKNQNYKMVVNIVEDVRIEKLIQSKYPGTIRSFKAGYDELQKQNLFGTEGRDINSYGLLDRLNIHFKVGHFGYINVPFSDAEKPWLNRVNACKSFEDVLSIARELMEYVQNNPESQGEQSEDEDSSQSSDKAEKQTAKVGIVTDEQSDSNTPDSENNADELDVILDPKGLLQQSPSQSDNRENTIRVETQQHFDDALKDLVDQNIKSNMYANLPDTQVDKIVVPYKKVHSQIRDYYSKYYPQVFDWAANQLGIFKNSSKNVVNQMANIFEMKKKARLDVRALTSKTGTLDMNKVHSYRYNDDIFKKVTTIPQGKSHGLVMFIDMSSSMYDSIAGTFEQLLNLVLFCRRVNIPFEVYGFTDVFSARDGLSPHPKAVGTLHYDDRFCLRQYFSHRMTGVEFNDALQNVLCIMQYYNRGSYSGIPSQEQLNCTPLNPAILAGIEVVNRFRESNSLDIVNTIFLTDGDDTHGLTMMDETGTETFVGGNSYWSRYSYNDTRTPTDRCFLRDAKTRRQWEVKNGTTTLLNILREQTGAKVIGFFLTKKRDAQNRIEWMTRDRVKASALVDSFKKNKFAEVTDVEGYDAYYIVPNGRELNLANEEFQGEIDTTIDWEDKKAVKRALKSVSRDFTNHMAEKMVSRVFLNRFIEHIS
jgi:hypothetical protein